MLSTVHTVAINGLTASRVLIEINVTRFDQPRDALFVMVGLPDSAVKESKRASVLPSKTVVIRWRAG